MRKIHIPVSILLLIFLTSACGSKAEATLSPNARTATFSMVESDVQCRAGGRGDYLPAEPGQVLATAAQARTGINSRATLDLLPDESLVRMGPETTFTLSELSDQGTDTFTRLEMEFGQLWIILSGGELQVETEIGVASVRGSMMSVRYTPGGALSVTCLEGTCSVTNKQGTTEFSAGQAVDVPRKGQPPSPARQMTEDEYKEWMEFLKTVQRGPRLGNRVWLDADWDGIQDAEEDGLENVDIQLLDEEDNLIDITVTGPDGYYSLPFVEPGRYYLVFEPPADQVITIQDAGEDEALDSDADPILGRTEFFEILEAGTVLLDWDAGMYPIWSAPEPTATATATVTPEPPPPCGCDTEGVLFEVVTYDGSPGWSDCGQATACHSIIGSSIVESGTVIGSSACSMRVTCP